MALETKPATRSAWMALLKQELAQPYTPEQLAQARRAVQAIRQRNAEKPWPPGTFQRLLDLAHAEDEEDADARFYHLAQQRHLAAVAWYEDIVPVKPPTPPGS